MRKTASSRLSLLVLPLLLAYTPATAADYETLVLADGTELAYALVLPEGFRREAAYPVILALPAGSQNREMVEWGLEQYWEGEARKRGFIVVSPVAPRGTLFFRGGEWVIPELLAHLSSTYRVEGGKFHLAGISNGGLSAFKVALDYPEWFRSLTVLAGYPPSAEGYERLGRLASLDINLYVGGRDTSWMEKMEEAVERFATLGKAVHFEVVPDNGHAITSLAGRNSARLFDRFPR